jgi:hypothetical protein
MAKNSVVVICASMKPVLAKIEAVADAIVVAIVIVIGTITAAASPIVVADVGK